MRDIQDDVDGFTDIELFLARAEWLRERMDDYSEDVRIRAEIILAAADAIGSLHAELAGVSTAYAKTLDSLQAKHDALQEELAEALVYAQHDPMCNQHPDEQKHFSAYEWREIMSVPCSCGLTKMLAKHKERP